ncbi:MAG: phage tail-like protein [Phenylobacterium sp.]|jgi:phage tail-like protein
MAITKEVIEEAYPIPVFQYMVVIEGMNPMAFSEVSGLNIEVEPITYKDGMSHKEGVIYMPGNRTAVKMTLKKGITKKSDELYQWISSISLNSVEKCNVTVSLLSPDGQTPVVSWQVDNAFPTKLEGPSFSATSNEVAFESIELMADSISITR